MRPHPDLATSPRRTRLGNRLRRTGKFLEGRARLRPGHCGRDEARPSQISPDATKRVPPDLRPSTFDFRLSWLSHAAERPSQSAGERPRPRGRAGGAGSLLRCGGRHAAECACAFPAVFKVRRGSAMSRFVTTHFPQFSLKSLTSTRNIAQNTRRKQGLRQAGAEGRPARLAKPASAR